MQILFVIFKDGIDAHDYDYSTQLFDQLKTYCIIDGY